MYLGFVGFDLHSVHSDRDSIKSRVEKDRSPDDASLLVYHVGSSFDISVPGAELRRIACLLAASPSVCEKEVSFLVLYFICPTSIEDMNYRLELECIYEAA